MIASYLVLILVPPLIAPPAANASLLTSFTSLSQCLIWCVWWPFVVLSMLFFGRAWCGLLCPEGALAAFASRFGGNRAVPGWMRWSGLPLVAFTAITVIGQACEVDERPGGQLAVLGGSTLLAIAVALVYRRRIWVWCRYLCPVSLLFGVFSRLGALHFRVDGGRLAAGRLAHSKEPCPVQIHLPAMSTNRHCLMCFRCAGWQDAIHLAFRAPGAELLRIDTAEPLLWEILFLFAGAIGLPLGVFHAEARELDGLAMAGLLLGCALLGGAVLATLTWASAILVRRQRVGAQGVVESAVQVGYLYAPLSLFSLFLGLSLPTFERLRTIGFPQSATDTIRAVLLLGGATWSAFLGWRILRRQAVSSPRALVALLPHGLGIASVLGAWIAVLFHR